MRSRRGLETVIVVVRASGPGLDDPTHGIDGLVELVGRRTTACRDIEPHEPGREHADALTDVLRVMVAIMSRVGRYVGMDQPVPVGAKRYLDVALGEGGPYASGRTYTSGPKKMTGPLVERTPAHLTNEERQDTALGVLENLTR